MTRDGSCRARVSTVLVRELDYAVLCVVIEQLEKLQRLADLTRELECIGSTAVDGYE